MFVTQLAEQQAQSLAASDAAEERIQALEQRLDSHAQASPAQQTGAGDPPAMAAPGGLANLAVHICMLLWNLLLAVHFLPEVWPPFRPCSAHSSSSLCC